MLFLQMSYPYRHMLFGTLDDNGNWNDANARLNTEYRTIALQSFDTKSPIIEREFRYTTDEISVLFLSYLRVPYRAFADDRSPSLSTMPDLICWYLKHNVDIPFKQWIESNPLLHLGRGRHTAGVFVGDDGAYYYLYVCHGRLQHIRITESCFIRNGEITTLAEVIAQRERRLQQHVQEVNATIKELQKENNWLLAETLDASDLLPYTQTP